MKTIFVIYTDEKVTDEKVLFNLKQYCFNTDADIKVGRMIKSQHYSKAMQVTQVTDKHFKYFRKADGALTEELNSTQSYPIKTLKIVDSDNDDTITGVIID